MTTVTESSRAVPALSGLSHLGLTVRDIAASEAWYSRVLGLVQAFAEPHPSGGGYAVVLTRPGTGLFVGLDHLALQVARREDLDAWITHLDALGIEHGAPSENTRPVPHALVVFRDPDAIPVELFWSGG